MKLTINENETLDTNYNFSYEIVNDTITITGVTDKNISELYIPDEIASYPVVRIKAYAFEKCSNLKKVEFGSNVTTIEARAFQFCNIETITIPNTITYIGRGCFARCKNLKTVNWESVADVSEDCFYECSSLRTFDFSNVSEIGAFAFAYTGLKSVTLPTNIKTVGEGAFYNCSELTTIKWRAESSKIEQYTFAHCINLTDFNFSKISIIVQNAFDDSGLEYILIDNNVKFVNDKAFANCKNLKEVEWYSPAYFSANTFVGCTDLENFYIASEFEQKMGCDLDELCNVKVTYVD